ncbi:3-isopropylmalate dehydratase small subunit [Pacificibacter marinus]|uniref:3-isopropylmalate dehydratase small subunit n=1 Tax=Pacificibacter marinus TaxID=658057 RepID=UPI001C066C18|nr:3-isopropylmalate dehydratase small subunit [Pacificibacter marinus]
MKPFENFRGIAMPMMRPDIDTEQMINRDFLITASRKGLSKGLFHDLRYRNGEKQADFVMNLPQYRDAKVLIGGPNFASGSSREHAVWAVVDYGIGAVIAPSYGVHFYRNALKNGLLPVILPLADVAEIAAAVEASNGSCEVAVSLTEQTVKLDNGKEYAFEIHSEAKEALLAGLDDIERTLRRSTRISAFQAKDRLERPWVYLSKGQAPTEISPE